MLKVSELKFPSPYGVSFILIFGLLNDIMNRLNEFPSPYEVSFILILLRYYIGGFIHFGFRLLTKYHSFLSYGQKRLLLQYVFRVLS